MAGIFIAMLLGHFIADWLLQPNKMAFGKSKPGWEGHLWCTIHCLIYTIVVCCFLELFLWRYDLLAVHSINLFTIGLVFLSHWPLDRWSLSGKWLKLIGSRDFMAAYNSDDEYREINIAFSCLAYAVADNTMHLVFLWLITFVI